MKKVLFVLAILLLINAKTNSQTCCDNVIKTIGDLTILPNNYTNSDTIKLIIPYSTSDLSLNLWKHFNIDSNLFTISACYMQFPLTSPSYYLDTIVIGILPLGNYTITVNKYCSCDTICTYSDTVSESIQFNITTGVNEFFKNNVSFFPNPATNTLYFNEIPSNANAEIYDLSGKLILKSPLFKPQIDVSNLGKGMYFIKLNTTEGSVVRKFVKE